MFRMLEERGDGFIFGLYSQVFKEDTEKFKTDNQ